MKQILYNAEHTVIHPASELSDTFEKMKTEHEQLKKKLNVLYLRARSIGSGHRIYNWYTPLISLCKEVKDFVQQLESHAEWEESEIFPLVCLHTGKSMEIFDLVEQEHEMAQLYLDDFLNEMELVQENYIGPVQAHELSSCLLQAFYILNEHFRKEEALVFPAVDKILEDTAMFYS